MSRPVALLDACVLYPQMLRDVMITLARAGFYQAKWTARINDEWVRQLVKKNPDREHQVLRTKELVNLSVEDCLIENFEHVIETVALPDPDDRHVLAAAIHGKADYIVTLNLSDFPSNVLEPHGIVAQSPDDFLASLVEDAVPQACEAIGLLRKRYRNPAMSAEEFLASLSRKGLYRTVDLLGQRIDLIQE